MNNDEQIRAAYCRAKSDLWLVRGYGFLHAHVEFVRNFVQGRYSTGVVQKFDDPILFVRKIRILVLLVGLFLGMIFFTRQAFSYDQLVSPHRPSPARFALPGFSPDLQHRQPFAAVFARQSFENLKLNIAYFALALLALCFLCTKSIQFRVSSFKRDLKTLKLRFQIRYSRILLGQRLAVLQRLHLNSHSDKFTANLRRRWLLCPAKRVHERINAFFQALGHDKANVRPEKSGSNKDSNKQQKEKT